MSVRPDPADVESVSARLVSEDVLGQLMERRGRMARLASESGRVRLDWVDALDRWLDDPGAPARLELTAERLLGGADRLLWSGMGGSVMTVKTMLELGLVGGSRCALVTLDSTDPRALNRWLDRDAGSGAALAVSMGLTSEEPLSHLRWLESLQGNKAAAAVMTIPGSVLEEYAMARGLPRLPVQPDGGDGTPGRMSAPGTNVFLLPALLAAGSGSKLRSELAMAPLDPASRSAALEMACRLHAHLQAGRNKMLVAPSPGSEALAPWVEQLVEESLGKGSRGLLVFPGQDRALLSNPPEDCFTLRLDEALPQGWTPRGFGDLARFFATWALTVAVVGYLEGITFVGQPAVEAYKSHARRLRDQPGELELPDSIPVVGLVQRIRQRLLSDHRSYFDMTLNADSATPGWAEVVAGARRFANRVCERPAKLRVAPAHYHSTEQAQVDGPPGVTSIRLVLRKTEPVRAGTYDLRYLHAQALGAALAMVEAGRPVDLVVLDDAGALGDLAAEFG